MQVDVSIVNKNGGRLERLYDPMRTLVMQALFDGISGLEMPLDRDYVLIFRTTVLVPEKTLFASQVEEHAILVIRERSEYPG